MVSGAAIKGSGAQGSVMWAVCGGVKGCRGGGCGMQDMCGGGGWGVKGRGVGNSGLRGVGRSGARCGGHCRQT